MNDNTKEVIRMLRALANGQSKLREDMQHGFKVLDKKIVDLDKKIDFKVDNLDRKLTDRIDKLGRQLAYLEDDSPTNEEFGKLKSRVTKLESEVFKN